MSTLALIPINIAAAGLIKGGAESAQYGLKKWRSSSTPSSSSQAAACSAGMKDEEMANFLKVEGIDFQCAKDKAVKYVAETHKCTPPPGISPPVSEEVKSDIEKNCRISAK